MSNSLCITKTLNLKAVQISTKWCPQIYLIGNYPFLIKEKIGEPARYLIQFMVFYFQGETGYPWIDAIMNQLRHEGWVHHVARHAVSSFLTRGDLWISWVDGLQVSNHLNILKTNFLYIFQQELGTLGPTYKEVQCRNILKSWSKKYPGKFEF